MKSFIAAAAGFGLVAMVAFAAPPAMAGITADQEAAQLDETTPAPSTPPTAQALAPYSGNPTGSPYAFNGAAQARIAGANHFGSLDQMPRSASQIP